MSPHDNIVSNPDAKLNWRVFQMIWPHLAGYRKRIALAFSCLLIAKAASVVGPFILKYIVDALDQNQNVDTLVLLPVALIMAYGLARFANVLFGELRDTVFGRVTERAMRHVGLTVFQHLHALDLEYHLNRRTGGLARDIERGTSGIGFLMRFFVFNIVPTFIEIFLVIGLLFYNYGSGFALITLMAIALYVAFSIFTTEWRTRFVREANMADSASNTRAIDSLMNYETVKYFTNEAFEADRYDEDLHDWEQARRKNRLSLFALNAGQALIIACAMTAMMMLAGTGVRDGDMSIGDFVLINAFMMQLFLPLNFLGFVYREIKGSMANIERMFDMLEVKPAIVDQAGAEALKLSNGVPPKIEFDDVSFRYSDEREILNGISFTIAPGERLAVVGSSGAGKSTLVKLLFRFYDPTPGATQQRGSIQIDGQAIEGLQQKSVRDAIGIVPQDTVLFNDTIQENIRYGRIDASDEEVQEAIKLAHLSDFISSLPMGVDTKVGERGLKLSGGEKQRVAIARTILKGAPIMVFDEATSSLDSRSEQAIMTALKELQRGHTSLTIAHRLSTIADADRIIVMGDGQIVEQGSHQQLMDRDGAYSALWLAQEREQHTTT
ncbi:MAG: ABC transporter ATP-binding protein/permease [Pseudomonadales bacterium]